MRNKTTPPPRINDELTLQAKRGNFFIIEMGGGVVLIFIYFVQDCSIVVHPSCLGRMEEFTSGSDWKHYVERFEMFFEVNSVPTDKRVPSILTLMGSKMYALLRSISAPRKPKEFNFTEIVDTLAQHVDPKPIIIAKIQVDIINSGGESLC